MKKRIKLNIDDNMRNILIRLGHDPELFIDLDLSFLDSLDLATDEHGKLKPSAHEEIKSHIFNKNQAQIQKFAEEFARNNSEFFDVTRKAFKELEKVIENKPNYERGISSLKLDLQNIIDMFGDLELTNNGHEEYKLRMLELAKKKSLEWLKSEGSFKLFLERVKPFFSQETSEEQLRAVFSGIPLNEFDPIKWTKSDRLLAYLIEQLSRGSFISDYGKWGIAEECFINKRGKRVKNLRSASNQSKDNNSSGDYGKPKDYEAIDDILSGL